MAQIKKHESDAARQKAYRERKRNATVEANVTPKRTRVWTEGIGERWMTDDEMREEYRQWFENGRKPREIIQG